MEELNPAKYNSDLAAVESGSTRALENIYSNGYYGPSNETDEKQLLRHIGSTIRKHWLSIVFFTLVVTIAVTAYVAQKPDYYKADARVQVNTENNPALGGKAGSSVIVSNPGGDPAYFTTQLSVLEGTSLMRRVVVALDLENNPDFANGGNRQKLTFTQNLRKMIGLYKPPAITDANSAKSQGPDSIDLTPRKSTDIDAENERLAPYVALVKKGLVVSPVKDSRSGSGTRLIAIEFTHENPVLAAKIANAMGDAYVVQNLEQKIQTNAFAGDFLEKRVADLQAAIRQGEERLINYSKEHQIISLDAGQNTVVQRLAALNIQLGQAENDRIAAQASYQAAMQNQMRSASAEDKDPQTMGFVNKLNELRQKLLQLKSEYTDEWPDVIQTKKQIASLETQLASVRKRSSDVQVSALQEKLNETSSRENVLRANFEQQRASVLKQNEAAINYNIIQQEIDTNKTLLQNMLERSRTNDVIMNDTPNNVLVAERATVPKTPSGPERTRDILLAFLVSLGAGCGLAFAWEWLNDTVENSDNIESSLGLALLGTVPAAPSALKERILPRRLLNRNGKVRAEQYNLQVFQRPEFVESYVQLRTHLMLSRAGKPPRTILITSGEESEGKSVTALNLARSLAQIGGRTLLIDADLRWPRIGLLTNSDAVAGLTGLLANGDFGDEQMDKHIKKNAEPQLDILVAGERSVNPTSLLSSDEMRNLLAKLSARYAHIVIDSPPVLYFADSTILSTMVDSVVMVVRDKVSSRQSVLKARKLILSVGGKLIGFVLNGVPRPKSKYYKYGYHALEAELKGDAEYQTLKLS